MLPKTIWFLWLQGLSNAPDIVKNCYESWVKYNPDWNVVLLNEHNIPDYISLKPVQVTNQALSDIIRINLLAKYGGVWVDASCFCTTPLDNWLPQYSAQGFFAFDKPGDDRMLSSWFIASGEKNHIVLTYQDAVNTYWQKNPGIMAFEASRWVFLFRKLQRRGTQIWFSTFVRKILKVYPYFWFHYLFESIYIKDKKVREIWHLTPKISADIPHYLQFAGLFNPARGKIKEDIDGRVAPVYKLKWQFEPEQCKDGTVLHYLLKSHGMV